ncbi:MAG: molybdenum cofactor guanylyltransferase [Thermomicrobiales bacterium]
MITAVVLAGGQSRRMGEDKAALGIDPASPLTMIEMVIRRLEPIAGDIMVVGGERDRRLAGARWVADAFPGEGPVGGLVTGLRAMRDECDCESCLVTPCDLPFLETGLLAAMAASESDADVIGLPARSPGGPAIEPFPAVFHRRCLPVAAEYIHAGGRSMRGLLGRLSCEALPEAVIEAYDRERWTLFNVNTPADLAVARDYLRQRQQQD